MLSLVIVLLDPVASDAVAPVWLDVSPAEVAPDDDDEPEPYSEEDGVLVLLLDGAPAVVLPEDPPYPL